MNSILTASQGNIATHVLSSIFTSLAELLGGRQIISKVNEIRDYYSLSPLEQFHISSRRLKQIVAYSAHNIPYYKDLFNSISFDPYSLDRDLLYLNDIPILTKDIIREHATRLISKDLTETKHYRCFSGGSTGPSIDVFYDQEAVDYSAATSIFARETIGCFRHSREVHLSSKFFDQTQSLYTQFREYSKCLAHSRQNLYIAAWNDQELQGIVNELIRLKPFLLHGHPSTLRSITSFCAQVGIRDLLFHIYESSGEMLDPTTQQSAESQFGCKVVNRYGLAEFGVVGYELYVQKPMQVMTSECWLEETGNGNALPLIATTLRNRLMPLIRYETGDIGSVYPDPTRGVLVIGSLIGRIHDVVTICGKDYPTHYIMDVLQHKIGNIDQFQILRLGQSLVLQLVLSKGACLDTVRSRVISVFGDAFDIRQVSLSDLKLSGKRNKYRHLVSHD